LSSNILRKFNEEISNLIGSFVSVVTSNGNKYKGKLIGITENLNLVLDNIESKEDKLYKIVLNGDFVSEIGLLSEPFNLRALGERLEKVFPGLVKIHEDIKAIIVMDKIKVTDKGMTEGIGLAAERVRAVYEEFIKDTNK
jgi:small nuclear ribonucleoprotein (snRNP)-like protein|tara:strand:- start:2569 stop:2988 length:420 start_codon:yes stop_codon:yes gene_type:complete